MPGMPLLDASKLATDNRKLFMKQYALEDPILGVRWEAWQPLAMVSVWAHAPDPYAHPVKALNASLQAPSLMST